MLLLRVFVRFKQSRLSRTNALTGAAAPPRCSRPAAPRPPALRQVGKFVQRGVAFSHCPQRCDHPLRLAWRARPAVMELPAAIIPVTRDMRDPRPALDDAPRREHRKVGGITKRPSRHARSFRRLGAGAGHRCGPRLAHAETPYQPCFALTHTHQHRHHEPRRTQGAAQRLPPRAGSSLRQMALRSSALPRPQPGVDQGFRRWVSLAAWRRRLHGGTPLPHSLPGAPRMSSRSLSP